MPWNLAHSYPTKDFFINMLTKDISIQACVLDLLDNCVDGARRTLGNAGRAVTMSPDDGTFNGFRAEINFDSDCFEIADNCGGISLSDAVDYAFHFGRRRDAPTTAEYAIGLYGIGMKRAFFKLGNSVRVESRPEHDPFYVAFDVRAWAEDEDWDFPIEPLDEDGARGTKVRVAELHDEVAETLGSVAFLNQLRRTIARDYAFLLQDGFEVLVNGEAVEPFRFVVRAGSEFKPIRRSWVDAPTGVEVTMVVGMTTSPPTSSEEERSPRVDASLMGWYVVCNGRTVLSGDKSANSVWGWENVPRWHAQYYGFLGIVRLEHPTNPAILPWGTTKREVDLTSKLYRRVRTEMRIPTIAFIDYTNARKANVERARRLEDAASSVAIGEVQTNSQLVLPIVEEEPGERYTSVQYSVARSRIDAAKRRLRKLYGERSISNSRAGVLMLEFFEEAEDIS